MRVFVSTIVFIWVFTIAVAFSYPILKFIRSLNQKEPDDVMRLYQVTLSSSDTVFAVIAHSEFDAIDALIEYFNCIHQSYTYSDFSANLFDFESVQYPMVFIRKMG